MYSLSSATFRERTAPSAVPGRPAYSDASTLGRPSVDYVSGEVERISPQLSFSFRFRAAQQDGWAEESYRPDGRWSPARETGARPPGGAPPLRTLRGTAVGGGPGSPVTGLTL
mgnify:CR=1 FL=1